nr:uncharacterized protein LOC109183092 [Ipomoea batatas]
MLEKCRQNTLLEVQPKIDMLTQQLNVLLKNMPTTHVYPQGVSVDSPQSAYAPGDQLRTRSSCQSVDMYPVTTIKSRKKCSLALCGLDGKPYVVARGTVYPTTNEITIVHNVPLLPNHVKVMVDEVAGGAEGCHLPVESFQYKTLGDIACSHAQWPTHLVILDEQQSRGRRKTSKRGEDMDATECGVAAEHLGYDPYYRWHRTQASAKYDVLGLPFMA